MPLIYLVDINEQVYVDVNIDYSNIFDINQCKLYYFMALWQLER